MGFPATLPRDVRAADRSDGGRARKAGEASESASKTTESGTRRAAEEERQRREQEEAEAKRRAAEEERQRREQEEAEAKRRAAEEARQRREQEEAEAKRRAAKEARIEAQRKYENEEQYDAERTGRLKFPELLRKRTLVSSIALVVLLVIGGAFVLRQGEPETAIRVQCTGASRRYGSTYDGYSNE